MRKPANRPEDIYGWRETRWGMDRSYVELLGLHSRTFEIGSRDAFDVELTFQDSTRPDRSRLSYVRLKSRDDIRSHDVATCREALIEAYGAPGRDGSSNRLIWRFPTTTVCLAYVLGRDGVIAIDFEPSSTFVETESAF